MSLRNPDCPSAAPSIEILATLSFSAVVRAQRRTPINMPLGGGLWVETKYRPEAVGGFGYSLRGVIDPRGRRHSRGRACNPVASRDWFALAS